MSQVMRKEGAGGGVRRRTQGAHTALQTHRHPHGPRLQEPEPERESEVPVSVERGPSQALLQAVISGLPATPLPSD